MREADKQQNPREEICMPSLRLEDFLQAKNANS